MTAEAFHTRIQKRMRIQIPRLLRWKYKLKPGRVMRVQIAVETASSPSQFLARMQKGGRITIPKTTAEILGLTPRQLVEMVIWIDHEGNTEHALK